MEGKEKCRTLKRIRAQIAKENDIDLAVETCAHEDDCPGICPGCEAETRELEEALEERRVEGKAVALDGVSRDALRAAAVEDGPEPAPQADREAGEAARPRGVHVIRTTRRRMGIISPYPLKLRDPLEDERSVRIDLDAFFSKQNPEGQGDTDGGGRPREGRRKR